uniref:Reverse transcriptase domain-containing protein n=1 Tax=Chromera velia CCMP2878 TaxID=1169474 RepID=A0A0K6S9Z0_9ALVE|eukprot:Cvel_8775.t2-p1 / transcript=Cvel_8775.t2 / gene=Cvel_8775 / organism=Chromera_velia_CCMP2878 / gene_product=hypothetical protein / transcript_product=hypothetical protein / location=Cvel_scaffold490:80861-82792(+) / protein_length=353 / sequence_SO=supercontig / SO=protein_coding / is_pseudo=false
MYPDRSRGMEEDRDYEVKDRTGEGDGCGCRKDGWDYHAHLPRCKVIRRGPILRDAGMASMPLILRVRGRRKVEIPPRREVEFAINLEPGHSPPARPPYRLSYGKLDEMKRQLDDYLTKGFIRPSMISQFAAPAFFVVKKGGSNPMRMCIDYHAINKITIKDKYAIPRAEDLLDCLHRAKAFSVLDMRQFFHQLRIRVGEKYKTAMSTRYGNYEWLVMLFGMCNPPPTSQRVIQACLRKVLDDCAFAWIDDVLIYLKTEKEHENDLRRVLGLLRKDEYYTKISKYKFFVPQVIYIGLEISKNGVRAEPKKAEPVQTWPRLKDKHELQVFLGLCNWFRRFIFKYSHVAVSLTSLL